MLTYAEIQEIIENRTWNDFIGKIEGDSFDGKREIYDLSLDQKKVELAKDVSAFANALGGVIIIGIETAKSTDYFFDEIVSLKPFPAGIFDRAQYRNILDSWVYPKISNIAINWVEELPGSDRGFGIINIPPQSEELKPDFDTLNWPTSILKFGPSEKSPTGYPMSGNDTPDKEKPRWTGEPKWSYLKRSAGNMSTE